GGGSLATPGRIVLAAHRVAGLAASRDPRTATASIRFIPRAAEPMLVPILSPSIRPTGANPDGPRLVPPRPRLARDPAPRAAAGPASIARRILADPPTASAPGRRAESRSGQDTRPIAGRGAIARATTAAMTRVERVTLVPRRLSTGSRVEWDTTASMPP